MNKDLIFTPLETMGSKLEGEAIRLADRQVPDLPIKSKTSLCWYFYCNNCQDELRIEFTKEQEKQIKDFQEKHKINIF